MFSFIKRFAPVAAIAMLLGACAATPHSKSTGQYVDDAAISAKVKSALIASSETKARDIDVNVNKGVVQLSGYVDNAKEIAEAQRIASNVAGVERVDNRLSIR
jgi:osmotically-inducible protein OsmY